MQLPDHEYFRLILCGEVQQVISRYGADTIPTAEDDRWAGYALYLSAAYLQARDVLGRAVARGCTAAHIELATVYRYLGEDALARTTLNTLQGYELDAFNTALARREAAMILLLEGHLSQAIRLLEQVWISVQSGPDTLRSSIGAALGWAHAQAGQDDRAIHVLDLAVNLATGVQRAQPLLTRGMSLTYMGRYEEASQDFTAAHCYVSTVPALASTLRYGEGVLRRAQGRYGEAIALMKESLSLAGVEGEVHFYSELILCALHSSLGQLQEASAALARAARYRTEPRRALYYDWRAATLGHLQGCPLLPLLEASRAGFAALGLRREEAWVALAMADHFAHLGDEAATGRVLNQVADLRYTLGTGAALAIELRDLPMVTRFIQDHPDHYCRVLLDDLRALRHCAPIEITLTTLGTAQILIDGKPVTLRLRRGIEVLAYLLDHGAVTREQVITDLWPNTAPKDSINYFHQVKNKLEASLPGLSVPFTAASGTYSVKLEGPRLWWDVFQIKRLLSGDNNDVLDGISAYSGRFLPDAQTEWVQEVRREMEWSVVKAGLQLIDRWNAGGQTDKTLELMYRLRKIDPWNEVLVEHLIVAIFQLEGYLSAKCTFNTISEQFRSELGEVPQSLTALNTQLDLYLWGVK